MPMVEYNVVYSYENIIMDQQLEARQPPCVILHNSYTNKSVTFIQFNFVYTLRPVQWQQ